GASNQPLGSYEGQDSTLVSSPPPAHQLRPRVSQHLTTDKGPAAPPQPGDEAVAGLVHRQREQEDDEPDDELTDVRQRIHRRILQPLFVQRRSRSAHRIWAW